MASDRAKWSNYVHGYISGTQGVDTTPFCAGTQPHVLEHQVWKAPQRTAWLSSCIFKIAGWSEKSLRVDSMFTCSVINSNALSNIWLPSNAVMAMNRNKPSSTIVGIRVSGVGSISRESAINKLEIKPDNLVSLTFTMLKIRKFSTRMLNW